MKTWLTVAEGAEYAVVRDLVETGAIELVQEAVIEYHLFGEREGRWERSYGSTSRLPRSRDSLPIGRAIRQTD